MTTDSSLPVASRRQFLQTTTRIAAVSALAGMAIPHVHAASSDLIQLALVGCGGRGTHAVRNAFAANRGPLKLVAMADVFETQLAKNQADLSKNQSVKAEIPAERRFLGFDAYKQAMDCLKPGDIVILATPPAFRWPHFTYAIEKGLNVFMEKPVTVDGPTSRRMFKLGEAATAKNLKVGVGLMSRHNRGMQQLAERIRNGEIGDVILLRGYRMHGPGGSFLSLPKPAGISDLMYQIQRFHSFLWASGGNFSDFYIHHIDHLCWMKNAWPVKAQAVGGRHYRQSPEGVTYVDQNFDVYSVEYTFEDGSKFYFDGRCMNGCAQIYHSNAHGSKGIAIVSKQSDCGLPSSIYAGQNPIAAKLLWESKIAPEDQNPYVNEWRDLLDAVRNDKPYNEVENGVKTSLVTSLGRMAAHTGQEITYEQILNSDHEFAPDVDKLKLDSPAPLMPDSTGRYPVPRPRHREGPRVPAGVTLAAWPTTRRLVAPSLYWRTCPAEAFWRALNAETHFKGWAKPGPVPPGLASGVTVEPHETLDAISGHFRLFQLRDGHRFSTDDILTAWYGTAWSPSARTALDLGSGIGTVGMICAWRLPGARLVTVEAQIESVTLARKSARYNGLTDRYEVREGDFRDPGMLQPEERFDLITGSPPYFPPGSGVESEHPQKLACRFELRGTVADYCAVAARHLASGGVFACVFPMEPAQLARMESGARDAGLIIVRRRPVVFREGEAPLVGLFLMMRAGDLPEWFRGKTWVEPDLIIRTRGGEIHPEYSAVKLAIGFPP